MALTINRIIIHELEKDVKSSVANIILSQSVIPNIDDPRILNLVERLNNKYRESNEKYGVFDIANPTVFHSQFGQYAGNLTEQDFIRFTQEVSRDLKARIENVPPAKGGYLLFADFNTNGRFISVYLVRNTSGVSFSLVGNQFNINDVQHIDVESLAMACRINESRFQNNEPRYLSFIHNNKDQVSKFFRAWIASTELESNKEDTQTLYDLLRTLPIPADENGMVPELPSFLDSVYRTIKNLPDGRVNLRTLSEILYEDADLLSLEAERRGLRINGDFKADKTVMRRFIQVKVKADGIDLSFPYTLFRDQVELDETDSSLVIIRSERLAQKVRNATNNPDQ